jgi:hypothetical protein
MVSVRFGDLMLPPTMVAALLALAAALARLAAVAWSPRRRTPRRPWQLDLRLRLRRGL